GAAGLARPAPRRQGRLRLLHRALRQGGQASLRPGECSLRAPLAAHWGDRVSRELDLSRRAALLGGGGVLGAAGLAGGFAAGRASADTGSDGPGAFALRGPHQAGIATPVQDRLHFAAFDVTTTSRARLISLLKEWTKAAERLVHGDPAGPVGPTQG